VLGDEVLNPDYVYDVDGRKQTCSTITKFAIDENIENMCVACTVAEKHTH